MWLRSWVSAGLARSRASWSNARRAAPERLRESSQFASPGRLEQPCDGSADTLERGGTGSRQVRSELGCRAEQCPDAPLAGLHVHEVPALPSPTPIAGGERAETAPGVGKLPVRTEITLDIVGAGPVYQHPEGVRLLRKRLVRLLPREDRLDGARRLLQPGPQLFQAHARASPIHQLDKGLASRC